MRFDDNGWASDPIAPVAFDAAYSLFAAESSSRVDVARWAHQARRFFDAALEVTPPKKYPADVAPRADEMTIELRGRGVRVVTVPIFDAPGAMVLAYDACARIGGAGMDAIVGRATRLWQIEDDGSATALEVAAVLASIFLAPIVPPSADAIFGVKGARDRLAKR